MKLEKGKKAGTRKGMRHNWTNLETYKIKKARRDESKAMKSKRKKK